MSDEYEAQRKRILEIIQHDHVKQFCVGISTNAARRRTAYGGWLRRNGAQLDGFEVVASGLTVESGLQMERTLFEHFRSHRKYANYENVRYFPQAANNGKPQSVYIAWWSPAFL